LPSEVTGDRRMAMEPDHQSHIYLGEPDEDLIESLEPNQLVGSP
jgi:hypothetical protein